MELRVDVGSLGINSFKINANFNKDASAMAFVPLKIGQAGERESPSIEQSRRK